MVNFAKKIKSPTSTLIEKTAGEMAAVYYEAGRSQGLTSKHPNARAFARANLELFIPKAIEVLTEMLGQDNVSESMKSEIYDALMERANCKQLSFLNEKRHDDNISKTIKETFGLKH